MEADLWKKIGAALIIVMALLFAASYLWGDGGPSDSLIKSTMTDLVKKKVKNCSIEKITLVRGDKFVPHSHRDVPKGTVFFPVSVDAAYTMKQPDGSMGDKVDFVRTFYFYKNFQHQWISEVNSF